MDDVSTITSRMIQEHESDPEVVNMMYLVDQHFDVWTTKLFPHLQRKRIPCYKTVVDILHKAGHTVATESLVRSYFSVIRARRGIPAKPYKAPIGVTPTVTLTRPAREFRADPGVRVQATDRPVAQAVSSPPVAVPGVEPVEVTDWHAEMKRLEGETRESPWIGQDQWIWDFYLDKAKYRRLNLYSNAPDVEKMLDPLQKMVYPLILAKKKRQK